MSTDFDKRTLVLAAMFPAVAIGLLNGLYKEALHEVNPIAFWFADLTQFVVVPLLCVYLLTVGARIYPRDYGFRRPGVLMSWTELLGLSVLMFFISWITYIGFTNLAYSILEVHLASFTYQSVIPEQWFWGNVVRVYFSATAALVEETMFRALPWLYFCMLFPKSTPVFLYAFTTALFFGFIHVENGLHEVFGTFAMGFVFAILYTKIKNIWPFVVAHFLTDLVAFS